MSVTQVQEAKSGCSSDETSVSCSSGMECNGCETCSSCDHGAYPSSCCAPDPMVGMMKPCNGNAKCRRTESTSP
jgi:hypothetical protein